MCLVEFESKFNATKAMESYDQTIIPGLGFVRIKFSNRSRIISKKNTFQQSINQMSFNQGGPMMPQRNTHQYPQMYPAPTS